MKRLNEAETKAKQAEGETERLLTLVSSTQEEQDIKDKLIKELQEWVLLANIFFVKYTRSLHYGSENLKKVQAKTVVKSNKSKIFFCEIEFLAV